MYAPFFCVFNLVLNFYDIFYIQGHQATVTAVGVLSDSRRVVSSDRQGVLAVWLADNATLLHTALGPTNYLSITNNMKYVISGDGDNK